MAGRMDSVQESGTVRMADRAKELQAKGINVISFSIGEPDFPTPEHIVSAAVEALRSGFTKYTPAAGIPELREAVAEKLRRENGIQASAKEVLVTPAKHAIFMSIFALVNRGDEVIIPDPCWVSYEPMVRMAEGKPVPAQADESSGFVTTAEAIEPLITERTRMIILNSPANPSGSVASKGQMEEICSLAKEHGLIIVSDEIYEHIIYDKQHFSPASVLPENVITVNGFSKTYAMTGWRLGYLHAPRSCFDALLKVQTHTVTCAPSFAQKAGVAALLGPQETVSEMLREFRKRRDMVVNELRSMPDFKVSVPDGAFYVFPSYNFDIPSERMAELLLDEAHVAVTPGISFGKRGEKHIRISYATSTEKLKTGLAQIRNALERLSNG
ncbi:MAG: pyridoxal phosphate-dependent aminotransferase [Methanomassiliicoccales archaeon]